MTVRNAYLIGSGPFDETEFLNDLAKDEAKAKALNEPFEAYFIGCDRGARRFVRMPLDRSPKMDLAIGDYDSISAEERQEVLEQAAHFISLPAEKDETDTEAALNEVLAHFPPMDTFLFYGMLDGRLDHTLHNVWLGHQPRYREVITRFKFRSPNNVLTFLTPGSYTLERLPEMKYLSFIGLETVRGLDIIDAKYPLANYDMPYPQSMVSNEFVGDKVTVQFTAGILIYMQTRDQAEAEKEA